MANDVTIQVKGLKEYQKALKNIDESAGPELRKGLNEVAEVVASTARSLVPVRSGRAAGSIQPGSTQRGARIKVGGDKAPYYLWLDFGGHVGRLNSVSRPFFTIGRYIYPTLKSKREMVIQKLDEVLDRLATDIGGF